MSNNFNFYAIFKIRYDSHSQKYGQVGDFEKIMHVDNFTEIEMNRLEFEDENNNENIIDIMQPQMIDNLDVSVDEVDPMLPQAWNRELGETSLSEVHGTVPIESGPNVPWYQKLMSYFGPGTLIAVGYMDPG